MDSLKDQAINFENLMEESWNKGMDSDNEDQIEKFYNSEFTISFKDKVTGKTAKIKFFICPETWDFFEHLVEDVKEYADDYEE